MHFVLFILLAYKLFIYRSYISYGAVPDFIKKEFLEEHCPVSK